MTHCGHGTTLKGLAAGVPLLCVPMGRDQNDTAVRVVERGAGLRLSPKASVAKLRAAVQKLLADARYREAAQQLARAIAGLGGDMIVEGPSTVCMSQGSGLGSGRTNGSSGTGIGSGIAGACGGVSTSKSIHFIALRNGSMRSITSPF